MQTLEFVVFFMFCAMRDAESAQHPGIAKCGKNQLYCRDDNGNYICRGEKYIKVTEHGQRKCVCGGGCKNLIAEERIELARRSMLLQTRRYCGNERIKCKDYRKITVCEGERFIAEKSDKFEYEYVCVCGGDCEYVDKGKNPDTDSLVQPNHPGVIKCGFERVYCKTDSNEYVCSGESYFSKDNQYECTCGVKNCVYLGPGYGEKRKSNPGEMTCKNKYVICIDEYGGGLCKGQKFKWYQGKVECTCGASPMCKAIHPATKRCSYYDDEGQIYVKGICHVEGVYRCYGESYTSKDGNWRCKCGEEKEKCTRIKYSKGSEKEAKQRCGADNYCYTDNSYVCRGRRYISIGRAHDGATARVQCTCKPESRSLLESECRILNIVEPLKK